MGINSTVFLSLPVVGLVLVLGTTEAAFADDFVVSADTTDTNGGHTVDGGDTLTINSGVTIDHSGQAASSAVNTTGGTNAVVNNGTIIGDGSIDGQAVVLNGNGSSLNNTGSISTTSTSQTGSHAVAAYGLTAEVTNSGSITTSGDNAHGVYLDRATPSVENSGLIMVTGSGSNAVHFNSSSTSYTTNGRTISTQGQAIYFNAGENGLNLNAPAYIEGGITLGSSSFVTINTGQSHSFQWTFDGAPWFSMTINGSVPTVISGATVASIDPTIFEAAPTGINETLNQIYDSIGERSQSVFPGATGGTQVSTKKYGPLPDDPVVAGPRQPNKWVSGFGSVASHAASGVKLGYTTAQAGKVAGMDWARAPDRIFGITAGGTAGLFAANAAFMQSHRVRGAGGFFGIYGAKDLGNAVMDYGVLGGIQGHNSRRAINNNLIVGGIDTGVAFYNSYYIAPRVSLRRTYVMNNDFALTTSGALGYIAGWVNGYTETATLSTATFNARRFGLGSARANITLTKTIGATSVSGQIGIIGQSGFGNEAISGTLLGQAWTYTTASNNGFSGLIDLSLKHNFNPNINGKISANANVGSAGLANIMASASLRIEF